MWREMCPFHFEHPGENIFLNPHEFPQIFWDFQVFSKFLFLNYMRIFERIKIIRENLRSDGENIKKCYKDF